jgi:hypothetical protein
MSMRIVVATLMGCTALMAAGTARAQVPDKLIACASRVDDADRLACYDAAVKSMGAEARAASEAREAEANVARAAAAASAAAAAESAAAKAEADRKASFGRSAAASEIISELQASITEVLKSGTGKVVFVLDNGQVWRQADTLSLPNAKAGTAVTIKRGALGSFRLVPDNSNRWVQVVRMR